MSDTVIREATLADNETLIELERRAPLLIDKSRVIVDRSPNFFARRELQEHASVFVAEKDGNIAGVIAGAWHETRIGGRDVRALYIHHWRVAAEYVRSGIGIELAATLLERWLDRVDLVYGYTFSENRLFSRTSESNFFRNAWPTGPVMQVFLLEAHRSVGSDLVSAQPDQASELVQLINGAHAGRDLFVPYTAAALSARLSRSASYGWRQIFVRERAGRPVAMAGLWDLGATLKEVHIDEAGVESITRPAVILDYGCAEGAEAEMAALLADVGALAAASGRQELWMSVDPASRLYQLLEDRPHTNRPLLGLNMRGPVPGGSSPPYLDFVYW
jgi:GNAT superfamily N-acetyltransferase